MRADIPTPPISAPTVIAMNFCPRRGRARPSRRPATAPKARYATATVRKSVRSRVLLAVAAIPAGTRIIAVRMRPCRAPQARLAMRLGCRFRYGRVKPLRERVSSCLPNARVQLRAVGSICGLQAAIRRSQQALNRNGFLRSRARQLQRTLDSPHEEPKPESAGLAGFNSSSASPASPSD